MVAPFVKNPLGGNLGARTASFYKLDPLGIVPVEPLLDLLPAFTARRVTLDAIESEEKSLDFAVTTNALQDFTSAQSNVHKELERITVTGIAISSIDLGLAGSVGVAGIPGFGGGLRLDLIKADNLELMANARMPIMFVSPRIDMPKAFIENITRSWDPDLGDNTIISISLVEARLVNPVDLAPAVADLEASATGNNAAVAAGAQAGTPVSTQSVTPGATFNSAPTIGAPPP